MKGILIFATFLAFFCDATTYAGVRDGTSVNARDRATATQSRKSTTVIKSTSTDANTRVLGNTGRVATTNARSTQRTTNTRTPTTTQRNSGSVGTRAATNSVSPRIAKNQTKTARATTVTTMSETRTGAAYTQCKDAYFQCMDQFCKLKDDTYQRCSCSDRVFDMINVRENLIETNSKLNDFTENLDMVGMTAAQATAIHTASDGENALTADTSASKALLTAIMNSIRGLDTTVSGKMSDLNSINLSFDTSSIFGTGDTAQVVASYNGTELYNAVYPACRGIVANDCNNASLQRAVTAYLMAVEQDCNTVQTALAGKAKDLKAAVREGSAMLDLARIENRNKHNSDNLAQCINNIETAILSEQVCGADYHKCLDNGEFIDVTTGAPIAGVARFYELGNLLKFDSGRDAVDQKLSQNANNRTFVQNFENKTKKFALDAMDKCTEIADQAWAKYLDKALLDIYYAQQAKVKTIKNGCFDLISQCYSDKDAAITAAMATLIDGTTDTVLQPDKITLTKQMCSDYITSCNNMFDDGIGIITDYLDAQGHTDTLAACRAVAQQCFDSFGGQIYENFYYPASGLFTGGIPDKIKDPNDSPYAISSLDWFSLYAYDENGERLEGYRSKCAKQVADITSCVDIIEEVFGGLDSVITCQTPPSDATSGQYLYNNDPTTCNAQKAYAYGWARGDDTGIFDHTMFKNRQLRPSGVATNVYNQIVDILQTQCNNVQGKFVEAQFINHMHYGAAPGHPSNYNCDYEFDQDLLDVIAELYGIYNVDGAPSYEYMCPLDYELHVDTAAWGICSCWENGGRRSKRGQITKCGAYLPTQGSPRDAGCVDVTIDTNGTADVNGWCASKVKTATNQVCPIDEQTDTCDIPTIGDKEVIPRGMQNN